MERATRERRTSRRVFSIRAVIGLVTGALALTLVLAPAALRAEGPGCHGHVAKVNRFGPRANRVPGSRRPEPRPLRPRTGC